VFLTNAYNRKIAREERDQVTQSSSFFNPLKDKPLVILDLFISLLTELDPDASAGLSTSRPYGAGLLIFVLLNHN
jgi:hypothetical protein